MNHNRLYHLGTVPQDSPKRTSYQVRHLQQEIYPAGMSCAMLLRYFRAALAVTPMTYLWDLGWRHAAELLLKTEFNLKEITA